MTFFLLGVMTGAWCQTFIALIILKWIERKRSKP